MAKFFLSPSNQTDNRYACGHTTESEACGHIADACAAALTRNGQNVMVMHDESIQQKVPKADAWGADYYVPIHTNASGMGVTGTRIFYGADRGLADAIFRRLAPLTPGDSENVRKDASLMEVYMPKAITAYLECEFHDTQATAEWIHTHTKEIGEAIAQGCVEYVGAKWIPAGAAAAAPAKSVRKPAEKKQLYRVRLKWGKGMGGQIGAFSSLDNAKKACKDGYFVFREDGKPVFYRVGKDDSLWGIAYRAYDDGKQHQEIMSANDLKTSTIYPGQGLEIPVMV